MLVNGDLRSESCNSQDCLNDVLIIELDRRFCDDVALSVPKKNLDSNLWIALLAVGEIDYRTGDAVGEFVRVCRIDFFVHRVVSNGCGICL